MRLLVVLLALVVGCAPAAVAGAERRDAAAVPSAPRKLLNAFGALGYALPTTAFAVREGAANGGASNWAGV
jgi:hypothetical protein